MFVVCEAGSLDWAFGHVKEVVGEFYDFGGLVDAVSPFGGDVVVAVVGAGELAVAGGVGVGVAAEADDGEHAVFKIVVVKESPERDGEGVDDVAAEVLEFDGGFVEGATDEIVDVCEPEVVVFCAEVHPARAIGGDVVFAEAVEGAVNGSGEKHCGGDGGDRIVGFAAGKSGHFEGRINVCLGDKFGVCVFFWFGGQGAFFVAVF